MSKYILLIIFILLSTKIIIGQQNIIDTIVYKNATVFTFDTVPNENKEQAKNESIFIVGLDDMNENTFFLFNDSIYSSLSFSEIEHKLDKKKRLKIYTSEANIAAYLNRKKLNSYIQSEIIDKNKKLLLIIENN